MSNHLRRMEARKGQVWLVPGDIRLTDFEGIMPGAWTESLAGQEPANFFERPDVTPRLRGRGPLKDGALP
jgi:hypothetical protein